MTQGELEKIPLAFERLMSNLEIQVMGEIVRAIKVNGFSTSSADYQMQRLIQLGKSESEIKKYVKESMSATDEELDRIFSDTVYEYYYGYGRAYKSSGNVQIPFDDNAELQVLVTAVKRQTRESFRNMTDSMGFAIRNPATGKITYSPLMEFYQNTLDSSVMEMISGTISYDKALSRAINTMTNSGLRWIDYDSGWHNRVNVAARRAVMTGFRQIQGKINEQVAKDLDTDSYEVSYHIGARPEHQPWQGRVWTYEELVSVCGLGTVTGLHGANCYHDYNPFIPGVSVRTYTDEQLDEMLEEENKPKSYNGKEYTSYEALQEQRRMETAMRKTRQDITLLHDGGADKESITLKKARYQVQMQQYKSFSGAMGLPEQMQRVYQDGLAMGRIAEDIGRLKKNVTMESDIGKGVSEFFGGISKQRKEFMKNLKVIKDADIRTLFKQSLGRVTIKRANGRRSRYSPKDKTIYLSKSCDLDTLAHELMHEIDITYGLTENGLLSKAVRNDFHRLQQRAIGYGRSVEEMLYIKYPNAFLDNKEKLQMKPEYRGISDVIHGCSDGKIFLGFGHKKTGYWKNPLALERETFAQYGRMVYDGNIDVLKMFKDIFPDSETELTETIRGMIK